MYRYCRVKLSTAFLCLILLFVFIACGGREPSNISELVKPRTSTNIGHSALTQPFEDRLPKIQYIIQSGDILEIVTWKEPDFTREEVLVRIDGRISFPLLDDVQAAGRTPAQVENEIRERLKQYIANPVVSVGIRKPESQKFYILGEVNKTGEYPLLKNLTVLQAFSLAGGFTEWASKDEIIVVRREEGKQRIMRVNYKEIVQGKNISQNVLLKADDIIIVP